MATRVSRLKNFSQIGEAEFQRVDIQEGLERSRTLIRIAERVSVVKNYGEFPHESGSIDFVGSAYVTARCFVYLGDQYGQCV